MSGSVSPFNPLQQGGVRAKNPPNIYKIVNFAPTSKDNDANVGDFWIYLGTAIYQLVGKPLGVAEWLLLSEFPVGAIETINTIHADATGNFTIESSDGSVSISAITNGLDLKVAAGTHVIETITTQDATVIHPTAGNINWNGAGSLTTTGSGSTATVSLTGLTNHAILLGQGTATIGLLGPTNNATLATTNAGVPQLLSMAADGDLLIGSSAGAPAVATLTGGTGISITNGHNSITIATSGPVATSYPTDSGTATPSGGVLNIKSGNASPPTPSSTGCGSSVQFTGSGNTVEFYVTDTNGNTIIGHGSGNSSISGSNCVGLGPGVLVSLSAATDCIAIGANAMAANVNNGSSIAIGTGALQFGGAAGTVAIGFNSQLTAGAANVSIGYLAARGGGHDNVVLGNQANSNSAITNSIVLGSGAGNYTSGTSDSVIIIGNSGTNGDANLIRIGTQGSGSFQQNQCFIAGITGVSVSNLNYVTINTSTGQLGSASGSALANSFPTDSGTATPSSGALNIKCNGGCGTSVEFTGSSNTVVLNVSDANSNTCIGSNAGGNTGSAQNTALGHFALGGANHGSFNTCIGDGAGVLYNGGEAGNTCIGNGINGNPGESNVIRLGSTRTGSSNMIAIGDQGSGAQQQNTCFIAGIAGVSVSNLNMVTINTSTGQLGSQTVTTSGTFTPTLTGATTAGTTTYVAQTGNYRVVGNLVFVSFHVKISAATGTGNAKLGGLPFAIDTGTFSYSTSGVYFDGSGWSWPAGCTNIGVYISSADTTDAFITCSGSGTAQAFMQMTNAAVEINFGLVYPI